jgi:hypothetical protein
MGVRAARSRRSEVSFLHSRPNDGCRVGVARDPLAERGGSRGRAGVRDRMWTPIERRLLSYEVAVQGHLCTEGALEIGVLWNEDERLRPARTLEDELESAPVLIPRGASVRRPVVGS